MTPGDSRPRSPSGRAQPFPGRQLVGLLAGLLVLAIAVPAVVASTANALRVGRARRGAEVLAAFVARDVTSWPGDALAGPGDLPRVQAADQERRLDTLAAVLGPVRLQQLEAERIVAADPWQNAYLVVRSPQRAALWWVVSAGPNGVIDSDLDSPAPGSGDDIVVRVPPVNPESD